MNTLVANEGWKEAEENHRFRLHRCRVRGAEKFYRAWAHEQTREIADVIA